MVILGQILPEPAVLLLYWQIYNSLGGQNEMPLYISLLMCLLKNHNGSPPNSSKEDWKKQPDPGETIFKVNPEDQGRTSFVVRMMWSLRCILFRLLLYEMVRNRLDYRPVWIVKENIKKPIRTGKWSGGSYTQAVLAWSAVIRGIEQCRKSHTLCPA